MAGASKPRTVNTNRQRPRGRVRDGVLIHSMRRPVARSDMTSRMRESASTDLWEPQGSNPLGRPGPSVSTLVLPLGLPGFPSPQPNTQAGQHGESRQGQGRRLGHGGAREIINGNADVQAGKGCASDSVA